MFLCYDMGHETPWIPRGTGKAPTTGDNLAERKQDEPVSGRTHRGSIQKLRLSMVPRVPGGWVQSPSLKDNFRASSETLSPRKRGPNGVALVRSAGRGISDRSLDLETDCPNHPETLWDSVSSESRLATASGHGMELPETRAPGSATQRERDCALEGLPVAPYKKKPKDLGPIWSSWMNRASCSFPISVGPGLRRGKPPSCITSTNRTGFPRSMRCRCRPNGNAWRFISGSGGGTLMDWMSALSLGSCSSTSGDPSFCCGIAVPSTVVKKSSGISRTIPGFIWNTSRPMPPNLTRLSMYGIRQTALFRTLRRRAWANSRQCYKTRCDDSGDHQGFFGPASSLLISLGKDRSFHYLCEAQ
jgi:hypothetical protein